ncbi:hypothetical protein K493DRAFT_305849 [Basidiobolus meristosporus CBS 931.73]|uniref:Hydrophobin n=1 Tax=Basidiobolus meristosporus CBS 931.73 TaxID=1314790 RepID=A0A1Y1XUC9_9FUNG|nr:hypothetical protein K493DRAFT_305849 [Basidiobolus meristosporus CBS 931.73]|eukprot:ORX89350.1 hypothetical protein K493DRAFT_305849 [Basidiobolus meristosporus CBS 931.73]
MQLLYTVTLFACLAFSVIASPFPVGVNVDVGSGPAKSPHVPPVTCDDAEVRIKALGLNINAVVCLGENDSMPPSTVATHTGPNEGCPLVDAKVRALGLDIRAVVCLKDRIDVFVDIH